MKRGVFWSETGKYKEGKQTENNYNVLLTIALSFCQSNVYIQCHETFESFAKYVHVYSRSHFRL